MSRKFAKLADRDPAMVRLAQQVAGRLVGFMDRSPESIVEEMELPDDHPDPMSNDSFLDEFDRLCFCCPSCDHWYAQSDNAHPGYEGPEWKCRECEREEAA